MVQASSGKRYLKTISRDIGDVYTDEHPKKKSGSCSCRRGKAFNLLNSKCLLGLAQCMLTWHPMQLWS